jgi:hypothetical protein
MALDASITQTQVQSVGLSNNVVVSGVLTATTATISNLTGPISGYLNSNLVSTVGGLISTSQVTITQTPFFRNTPTISADYNVTTTYNEMSIGPVAINAGVTVTVNSGATWTVI